MFNGNTQGHLELNELKLREIRNQINGQHSARQGNRLIDRLKKHVRLQSQSLDINTTERNVTTTPANSA